MYVVLLTSYVKVEAKPIQNTPNGYYWRMIRLTFFS